MGSFGGYYKGEKKKAKKSSSKKILEASLGAPTISMPEIISRKKKTY